MNTTAIIRVLFIVGLFVVGWSGLALAGEVCDKLPTAPGAKVIVASNVEQLADAVGDPESTGGSSTFAYPIANPGDFVCIAADLTLNAAADAIVGAEGINITIPNITIYGAIVASPTAHRAILTDAVAGGSIFIVGATGAQTPPAPNGTRNPTGVVITDPTFDCAGASATAITVMPGANYTVIELNTIGGLTGACSTAGVLVRADRDTNNDQSRDDTDGDGILEDTVGTRIRANVFDAQSGDSGPAIWLEENVVGVGDPNAGTLEDQPPFEQCTGATAGSNHTVVGSSSANAGFATTTPFGPIVGNGPGADDGNLITGDGDGDDWEDGIRSEGSHICIRGNVILTPSGITTSAAIDDNGIQLDPGANGTAVWGNIIGSLDDDVEATEGDGIAVLGPFKLTSVLPDGDSLYDNIVGNVGSATQAALLGATDDGFVCEDERIFVQGSSQGAQRAVDNGDEGFDLGAGGDAPEGFGCTKRDAVFNNDAINNGGNGFEGGSDFVDNDALVNSGHGFLVPGSGPNRFCGNVANDNGNDDPESGFAVDSNNLFTDGGTFGSATCARGGNTANANFFAGFFLGISAPSLNATGNRLTRTAPPGLPFSTVHQANCNGVIGVFVDGNNNWIAHTDAFSNGSRTLIGTDPFFGLGGAGFTLEVGAYGNKLTQNRAGSLGPLTGPSAATCPVAGVGTGTTSAPVQGFGLGVQGGNGPSAPAGATANVAWLNIFGDPDYNSDADLDGSDNSATGPGTGGPSVRTPGPLEGNHYGIALGRRTSAVLRLEEQDGLAPGLGTPQDLDGDGISGMACNRIVGNNDVYNFSPSLTPPRGGVIENLAIAANLQLWADADGAGGTRLSNIWEGNGTFTGSAATTVPSDLANGSTIVGSAGVLNFEGAWTLVTFGPTPDIFVDPGLNTVQVSSPRNGGATTVDGLFAACVAEATSGGGGGGGGGPAPQNIIGDVNLSGSFDQTDVNDLLTALRSRAAWLTDSTSQQFQNADVARPCGRITRADYSRLRSSFLRVQRGRSPLASQCGSKGIIGQAPPASAPRLMTVLSGQAGAATVQVTVYSLTGRLLFEQKAAGAQVALDLAQRELANGVYLAVVTSVGPDGRVLAREVRKFVVLR